MMVKLLPKKEAEAAMKFKTKTKGKKTLSSEEAASEAAAYRTFVAEAMKKAEEEHAQQPKRTENGR